MFDGVCIIMEYEENQRVMDSLPKIDVPTELAMSRDIHYIELKERELQSYKTRGFNDPVIVILGNGPYDPVEYRVMEREEALVLQQDQTEQDVHPQIGAFMYDLKWFEKKKQRLSA